MRERSERKRHSHINQHIHSFIAHSFSLLSLFHSYFLCHSNTVKDDLYILILVFLSFVYHSTFPFHEGAKLTQRRTTERFLYLVFYHLFSLLVFFSHSALQIPPLHNRVHTREPRTGKGRSRGRSIYQIPFDLIALIYFIPITITLQLQSLKLTYLCNHVCRIIIHANYKSS